MDFDLNDEQLLLRHGLRELLDRACTTADVRAIAYNGDGTAPALWRALADSGWTSLAVPEANGGMGLGFEAAMVAATECGRALLPLPLPQTLLASRAIAASPAAAAHGEALAAIASGAKSATIGLAAAVPGKPGLAARRVAGGWELTGTLELVPFGPLADLLVTDAALETGGRGLFLLGTRESGLTWTATGCMDATTRRHDLVAGGMRLAADAALYGDGDATAAVARLCGEAQALQAADTLGAAERLVEITAEYAKQREQFGRPVGSNQAVKVRMAEMSWSVERMRVGVYWAAMAIERDLADRDLAIAMAAAAASTPGYVIGTQSIHVHGAIGFTWEHDAHFFYKRMRVNELLFGDTGAINERVADLVLA